MVIGPLVWMAATAYSCLFAWLGCRFAEGLFEVEFDGDKMWTRSAVVGICTVFGSLGSFGYEAYLHLPEWQPISDLYTLAIWVPLIAIPALAAAGAALYGSGKLFFSFGSVVNWMGKGVRTAALGLRNLFKRDNNVVSVSQKAVTPLSAQPELSLLEQARAKFADVRSLCNALLGQLREGAAFDQVGNISAGIDRVSAAIEEDQNKQSVVPMLISDYLVPIEQGLRLYERLLKRNLSSAQAALKEMEEDTLPLMHSKVVDLYDQIHVGDIAQLSTVASTLEVARRLEVRLEAPAEANV